jgi:hypothetical protein
LHANQGLSQTTATAAKASAHATHTATHASAHAAHPVPTARLTVGAGLGCADKALLAILAGIGTHKTSILTGLSANTA